jgi:hypothetical protein
VEAAAEERLVDADVLADRQSGDVVGTIGRGWEPRDMDDGDGRRRRCRPRRGPSTRTPDDAWLTAVAEAASRDAGGVPVELLGEYLPLLADAAAHGRRPGRSELEAVGLLGRTAAELGVSAGRAVDLYLSAAWAAVAAASGGGPLPGQQVVRGVAEAVLYVVDDAVATLAEGTPRRAARWSGGRRRCGGS